MSEPTVQNVNDLRKQFSLPTQAETNYRPAGGGTDIACSSCRFYLRDGWDGHPVCHLIDNWPEPIEPNGLCDRHEIATPPQMQELVPVPVVIVGEMEEMDMEEMSLSVPKRLVKNVKEFVGNLLKPETLPEFQVFKAANGRKAWVARHTGKWVDREGEIIADVSHDAYVKRVQEGVTPLPELWMGHAKGTRHGEAIAVWKSGGFVLAAGYIDDTPVGDKAFAYYQKHAGGIKLSHMFHYPIMSKIDGVYYDYNTIEITTLLDGLEAFPYTSFQEIQTMSIPPVIQNMISEGLGADVLQVALSMDKAAVQDSKSLDGQGIASKQYDQYSGAVKDAADQLKALQTKLTDTETRLTSAETALKAFEGLQAQIKQLSDLVQSALDQSGATVKADNTVLDRLAAIEKQLAENADLAVPASKSNDTLLNAREKSILDGLMDAAKSGDQMSIVDRALGGQPSVSGV